jgi:oxygen-independent coproporphyrinogen-3 oxidase
MPGIYIHIPFCKQKCHYCNFFSLATSRHRGEFTNVLLKEIDIRKDYLEDRNITTVYFGGGTPSLLSTKEISMIISRLARHFHMDRNAEITLEANPDDISLQKARELASAEINRISIGVQSFHHEDLVYLNRVHDASTAVKSIELLQRTGFKNLTIDLIYGIPTLSEEKWIRNLETFFKLDIKHLSAYALTVENKTALYHLIRKKKIDPVKEEDQVKHFRILQRMMEEQGFVHYEISNFAKPGHYSRHNSIYWLGGHYLGLGPSAHSYNGKERQWNVSNLSKYIQLNDITSVVEETECLTPVQQFNEYVMTSLRTVWGCDLEHIENVFGKKITAYLESRVGVFIDKGMMYRKGNVLLLTTTGKLFADGISSDLFLDEGSVL